MEVDLNAQVEEFMLASGKDIWTIVPASVALKYEKNSLLTRRELMDAPSDRIIYYLLKADASPVSYVHEFIRLLKAAIIDMPGITSML